MMLGFYNKNKIMMTQYSEDSIADLMKSMTVFRWLLSPLAQDISKVEI